MTVSKPSRIFLSDRVHLCSFCISIVQFVLSIIVTAALSLYLDHECKTVSCHRITDYRISNSVKLYVSFLIVGTAVQAAYLCYVWGFIDRYYCARPNLVICIDGGMLLFWTVIFATGCSTWAYGEIPAPFTKCRAPERHCETSGMWYFVYYCVTAAVHLFHFVVLRWQLICPLIFRPALTFVLSIPRRIASLYSKPIESLKKRERNKLERPPGQGPADEEDLSLVSYNRALESGAATQQGCTFGEYNVSNV